MFILGLVVLILGLLLDLGILLTIGIILMVIGAVFFLLGSVGRQVGPRRYYW